VRGQGEKMKERETGEVRKTEIETLGREIREKVS